MKPPGSSDGVFTENIPPLRILQLLHGGLSTRTVSIINLPAFIWCYLCPAAGCRGCDGGQSDRPSDTPLIRAPPPHPYPATEGRQ